MTRFALLAMVAVLAGACSTAGDSATQDTATSVIAPAPDSLRDTLTDSLRDTTDTLTPPPAN